MPNPSRVRKGVSGFTLVEAAMALVISGIVILIVFPALVSVRSASQRAQTDANLQSLLRATAAFVQANGCLPCPTPPSTTGNGLGWARGEAAGAPCAACATPKGIPPFISLGLPSQMARDGWGRWITMQIDPAMAINFGVIPPAANNGLCAAGLQTSPPAITVKAMASDTYGQAAAVVFLSHGQNGYGAFKNGLERYPFPNALPMQCSSGNEPCNASDSGTFANAPVVLGGPAPFDDILLFIARNPLVSLFGNGSCNTTW